MQSPHQITVAVTGASGFVGNALIAALTNSDIYRVSGLRHSEYNSCNYSPLYQDTWGDLLKAETMEDWPPPESTLVHLAYMWNVNAELNYKATNNLLNACQRSGVKRLIHVSTAAVVGRAESYSINEKSSCCPHTVYGQTKLRIEEMIRENAAKNNYELVILRPTSIYGRGGAPLMKLCRDLRYLPWPINYLKACLFGSRAMNLVHLNNVIAAIRFFIDYSSSLKGSIFIISDDHDEANSFINVEENARELLRLKNYPISVLPLPGSLLSFILRLRSRNIINPYCRFSSDSLFSLGFHPPVSLEDGLRDYFEWYRKTVLKLD